MRGGDSRPGEGRRQRRRAGAALVAALALLALASALLAGAFSAATAAARATRAVSAGIRAEGAARSAAGSVLAGWGEGETRLAVGAWLERPFPPLGSGSRMSGRTRVRRLSGALYVVSADVAAGDSAHPDARRRLCLLVVAAPADSTHDTISPMPVPRWALSDLY